MKQLIASLVEQFQLNLEKTKCPEFQFYVAKLQLANKDGLYSLPCTGQCTGYSTKEVVNSFFRRAP